MVLALAALLGCSEVDPDPAASEQATPEPTDSGSPPALAVSILDPTTFEPLADGDELALFVHFDDIGTYLSFALEVAGTSGTVEVDPSGATAGYTEFVNPVSDGYFAMNPTEDPAVWRLGPLRAEVTALDGEPAAEALDGAPLVFGVEVTDLASQANGSQTLSLVVALAYP